MPRNPLAWLPVLQHSTRCLGESGQAITQLVHQAVRPG